MGLCNRDKDVSEQLSTVGANLNTAVAASAGISYDVATIAFPCELRYINVAAESISGAPLVNFQVKRFLTGAGVTTLGTLIGATTSIPAFGTSGAFSVSLLAQGNTLLQLQTGDKIVMNQLFSGGNVGSNRCAVNIVVKALQDIKEHFGLTS